MLSAVLPPGVTEVIPGALFVGGAAAIPTMLNEYNVRAVVRCEEEPFDYQSVVDRPWKDSIAKRRAERRAERMQRRQRSGEKAAVCSHAAEEASDNAPDDSLLVEGAPQRDQEDTQQACAQMLSSDDDLEDDGDDAASLDLLRPRENIVHTCHCPMQDTMSFDFLNDCPEFSEAIAFIDGFLSAHQFPSADDDDNDTDERGTTALTPEEGDVVDAPPANKPSRPALYVHCHAGRSRSPTVVLAYLITCKNMTLQTALEQLSPACRPNPNFMRQLVALSTSARGEADTFDLHEYYIDSLCHAFPMLDAELVVTTLSSCNGEVETTKSLLMREAFKAQRHDAMVKSLAAVVNEGGDDSQPLVSENDARRVYQECGCDRQSALLRLMELRKGSHPSPTQQSDDHHSGVSKSSR